MFHVINHIIRTNASGQLVINHVIFHTHLTFFNEESINSILNHTKNIRTIIQLAQINDSFIFHHIISADPIKNNNVIPQITKSNFCKESINNFFILII